MTRRRVGTYDVDNLDLDEIRELILEKNGNVAKIAAKLKLDSEKLRLTIMNSPPLARAMEEVIHRGVDRALAVLFEGLDQEAFPNRLSAAKEFLKTRPAQRRGFHHAHDLEVKLGPRGGALTLTWLPPEEKRPEPPMIEGEISKE